MHEQDYSYCFNLLYELTTGESLRKHGHAVAACMEYYAAKLNEDTAYWKNVGLLHDFDYEKFPTPEEHPYKGAEILRHHQFEDSFIEAIMSHVPYAGIPRDTKLKQMLFACDELSGFLVAVSYVRPGRSLDEVEVKSVLKKMKDKAFARQVSRDDIVKGAELAGILLEEHIGNCITALRACKELV
ncbi:MAG: HDIG domain-containing protein [Ignavibacteriales bacterium]|nr:HDIG domain-containing protein [Ignavibacteriales bacterium]